MLIFERERETECQQGRGRERGRHGIRSRLQALSCQHRAQCGAQAHKPWDHDLSQSWTLNRLSHPRTPKYLLKANIGAPVWLNWLSFQLLILAQVMISQFMGLSPVSGSVLRAQSLEPASDSVSPFLSLPLTSSCCVYLSKINKNIKKRERGAPGWLSQLSCQLRLRSWSCSPWVWAPHQALCWQLRAWSLLWILCLTLCLPYPAHALSLSVSKINKNIKK